MSVDLVRVLKVGQVKRKFGFSGVTKKIKIFIFIVFTFLVHTKGVEVKAHCSQFYSSVSVESNPFHHDGIHCIIHVA